MQTKLTLRLDDKLIQKAKSQAKKSGKSLSQMVADYFKLLSEKPSNLTSKELPPITRTLIGMLKTKESITEDNYHHYLEDKYL